MTLAELETDVREIGRFGSNVDPAEIRRRLNKAQQDFQRRVLWVEKSLSWNVREYFSTLTTEYIRLTVSGGAVTLAATNVAITTTARVNTTGAQVATDLTATIATAGATNVTVTFSRDTFKFTITDSDSDSIITVGVPTSGTDATWKLFQLSQSSATSTTSAYVGDTAPYCTSEYPLGNLTNAIASDWIKTHELKYDGYDIFPETYKGRTTSKGSTPSRYYVRDTVLGVTGQPTDQYKRFDMVYYYLPSKTAMQEDSDVPVIPEQFHEALSFHVVYMLLLGERDIKNSLTFRALYDDRIRDAKAERNARLGGAVNMWERGAFRGRYVNPYSGTTRTGY